MCDLLNYFQNKNVHHIYHKEEILQHVLSCDLLNSFQDKNVHHIWSCLAGSSEEHVLIPKHRVGAYLSLSILQMCLGDHPTVLDSGTIMKICLSEKSRKN